MSRPVPVPLSRFRIPELELFDVSGSIFPEESPDELRRLRHLGRSLSTESMPEVTARASRT